MLMTNELLFSLIGVWQIEKKGIPKTLYSLALAKPIVEQDRLPV